ncbi:CcdC family protein [Fictibacillus phosphorivorans]|uniref:CcdC family protein n=1 Tax=Fictibacillus phosphorivorans TaxID=1221500 RepID=UPI0020420818|nr:cytochrome c biogenesis protein CcdC [Fictibacillus phosphorivorans]MCM3774733.1 cytochrome c biogenesis protein CcdC [Fictibacillus phosphorivorans]
MFLIASTCFAIIMGIIIFNFRMRETREPVTSKKIIIPPIAMSTGFLQFVFPAFHVTWTEAGEAFLVGMMFSIFLIMTSKFEIRGDQVYLVRSKAFIFIIIGLFAIRLALKWYIGASVSLFETSSLFFIVAFGMILPWRLAMLFLFKKKQNEIAL